LDEVHRLIEDHKFKFILTGSSARKLKAGKANLLAGRAWVAHLYPLTFHELKNPDLSRMIQFGSLPSVYLGQDPEEDLDSYVSTYLREEIQAEGLIRKTPQFSRFLESAAISSGELINYESIARDSQNSASTIREYYSILEDTLIGNLVHPWKGSKKRKAISTSKFYFFDTGVLNTLAGIKKLSPNDPLWGNRLEHLMAHELRSYIAYRRIKEELCHWRSTSGFEVDFVYGQTAIEVKSSRKINANHFKGLLALKEESHFNNFYLVSNDPVQRTHQGIECLPWGVFIKKLWAGEID
jgi:predicted AAA+ superfamily ATPase